MKKQLFTLVIALCPAMGFSQVSLTSAMAPATNSMMLYYDANVPNPPFTFAVSGTTNTWDFSALTASPADEDTTFIAAPSNVPGGSSFPTATMCTRDDGDGSYTVRRVDAVSHTFLGIITDPSGSGTLIPVHANAPLTAMTFPYAYGSTAGGTGYLELLTTGASAGQPLADSVHFKSSVNVQINVVAAGTIVLPSGSFPAILERNVSLNIDSIWFKSALTGGQWTLAPGSPEIHTDSSYNWYTNQSLIPVAHALFDESGALEDVNYYKGTVSGVAEQNVTSSFSLYPNPVENILHLQLPENNSISNVKIYNFCGQLVMESNTVTDFVDVNNLEKGIYIIQVTDAAGNISSNRFVKN